MALQQWARCGAATALPLPQGPKLVLLLALFVTCCPLACIGKAAITVAASDGRSPSPVRGSPLAGPFGESGRSRSLNDQALLLPAAPSIVPAHKRAIYWEGDRLAFNATATRSVIGRGFTHVVVGSVNSSRWLCSFAPGALRPILDVSPHNKAATWPPLRTLSPFSQLDALKQANASLLRVLRGTTGCIVGVMDDIEEIPFPLTSYTHSGSIDSYHSTNFTDLVDMIGTPALAVGPLHRQWPSFVDWPTFGAHRVPNLTIDAIEYNFPKLSLQIGGSGSDVKQQLGGESGPRLAAQSFVLDRDTPITRADLILQRPPVAHTLQTATRTAGDPLWAKTWGSLSYFIVECTSQGLPNMTRKVLCSKGCGVQASEISTRSQHKSLYLNPTEATLLAARKYAFVIQYDTPLLEKSNSGSFELGCTKERAAQPVPSQTQALLLSNGPSAQDASWRSVPGVQMQLSIYAADPPRPLGLNQLHADWVAFRVAAMAGYVRTYAALVESVQPSPEVYIYSGYEGNPKGYPRSSHNYQGSLPDSYSVNWTVFADAGLGAAVCGYGTQDPTPTREALLDGSPRSIPPPLICGARKNQAEFADRYAKCDGAFEFFSGRDDPGFVVPTGPTDEKRLAAIELATGTSAHKNVGTRSSTVATQITIQ